MLTKQLCLPLSKYASVNISTNLYVVTQPWLYSLAWCAGAQSVTTNAVHVLKALQRPLFLMVRSCRATNPPLTRHLAQLITLSLKAGAILV